MEQKFRGFRIVMVNGHVEVYNEISGKFSFSADTVLEAIEEIKHIYRR